METERICPNCRKPLPPDVPLELCPECLIKSGFPTETEPDKGGIGRFVPPPVEEIAGLFPQFEILGFIGKGGMGAVYKARQPALDRLIALKVLPPAVGSDPGFAERFNREARALARLSHPNIVVVYDFGKAGPLHYLVMEFVDGTNLREVERAGRLSAEQALAIVPQICEALQFAHNEGIVHRDIKPENLLLDKKGRVKITDFGIAKILDVAAGKAALTGAREVVGTPHYMAPEQIEKPQAVDHRADIYSLGVVFYEMLTGELPLGKFAPPSKKVQVDVRLDEVVLHTLEKEPGRRYQHASQVKTDVETIAGTPPVRGAPAAAPPVILPPTPESVSDKILLPTFLLAFFFGIFGAHRFYVGKIGTGLLQLFTLGGFGIWTTIDWILILCQVFTDGDGRRVRNWWHPSVGAPKPAKQPRPPRPQAPPVIGTNLFGQTFGGTPLMIVAPAIALVIAGFIKIFGLLLIFVTGWPYSGLGHFLVSHAGIFSPFYDGSPFFWMGNVLFAGAPAAVMIYGATEMIRCRSYAWGIAGSLVGIVFCSTLGFPAGIWALIILLLPGVRERFANSPAPVASESWVKILGGAGAAGLLIFLIMSLAGLMYDNLHATARSRRPHVAVRRTQAQPAPATSTLPTPAPSPPSPAPPRAPTMPAPPVSAPAPITPAAIVTPAPQIPAQSTDAQKRILKAQLNETLTEFTNTEARYSIGTATSEDVDSAKDKVETLKAELAGDADQIAKIRVAAARRELDLKTQLQNVGRASADDVARAQANLVIATAQLDAALGTAGETNALSPSKEQTNSVPAMTNGTAPPSGQRDPSSSPDPPAVNSNTDPVRKTVNADDSTDFSQTFETGPGGKLTMNVDRGDIRITASDGNEAIVRVTRKLTGASGSEAVQILKDEDVVLTQNGNEISLTAQNPPELQHFSFFNHPNLNAQYEITLPRKFDVHTGTSGGDMNVSGIQGSVHVETSGGDINASGIRGKIYAETSGGDINAADIQGSADLRTSGGTVICGEIEGDVTAHTSGGDVRATKCNGRLGLESSGGSIRITEFTGPGVQAKTSGGSVSAEFAAAPTEESELKTSGGSITVRLPDNAALQLEGQTFAGSTKSDFPVNIKDNFGNGTLSGAINGGGPVLRMETSGGNVEVMKIK